MHIAPFVRSFRRSGVALAVLGLLALSPARAMATITFYADRSAFDAAEPGLPVEDFQPLFASGVVHAPLSSTSNNAAFAPGNILPGITISNQISADVPGLYFYGGVVGPYYFEDPLVLSFAPGVTAVATDLFGSTGTPTTFAGTFTADIYDGATLLTSKSVSQAAGGSAFLGFSSTSTITKIVLNFQRATDGDGAPYVDNIAFGGATTPVPEPATWTMMLFGAAAAGASIRLGRRNGALARAAS